MILNTSTIYRNTNANGSNYMHHEKDIQRNTNNLFYCKIDRMNSKSLMCWFPNGTILMLALSHYN